MPLTIAGPGRYTPAFAIMIGLLVVGFLCNEFIYPVNPRFHELASEQAAGEAVTAA